MREWEEVQTMLPAQRGRGEGITIKSFPLFCKRGDESEWSPLRNLEKRIIRGRGIGI